MEEKYVYGVVQSTRVELEKRTQNLASPVRNPSGGSDVLFTKRSERLREELIGLMLAFSQVRSLRGGISDEMILHFLEKHPLYFFIVQAGSEGNPLDLIEEKELQTVAGRLLFRILDGPDFAALEDEERLEKAVRVAEKLLIDLKREVIRGEELVRLELALKTARQEGEREKEKELLARFVLLSRENR